MKKKSNDSVETAKTKTSVAVSNENLARLNRIRGKIMIESGKEISIDNAITKLLDELDKK